jgi:NAD:arginine ADP-ribosyltransferase
LLRQRDQSLSLSSKTRNKGQTVKQRPAFKKKKEKERGTEKKKEKQRKRKRKGTRPGNRRWTRRFAKRKSKAVVVVRRQQSGDSASLPTDSGTDPQSGGDTVASGREDSNYGGVADVNEEPVYGGVATEMTTGGGDPTYGSVADLAEEPIYGGVADAVELTADDLRRGYGGVADVVEASDESVGSSGSPVSGSSPSPSQSVEGSFASAAKDSEPSAGLTRISDVSGEDGGLRNPLSGKIVGRDLLSFDESAKIASGACKGLQQCLPTSLVKAQQLEAEFPQLSLDQIRALVLYTMEAHPRESSFYFAANAALRSRKREDAEPFLDLVHLCLTALRLLPPAKAGVVVRGMREPYEGLGANYAKGSQFQLSGFTSTAERVEVMETFVGQTGSRTLLHLQLTQGDARDIRRFSLFPDESEVILPPNAMFVVESVFAAGGGMTLVQCRQIEPVDPLLKF